MTEPVTVLPNKLETVISSPTEERTLVTSYTDDVSLRAARFVHDMIVHTALGEMAEAARDAG